MFSGISDFLSLPFLNGIGGEWNWLVKFLAWLIIGGIVVSFKWVFKPIDEGFVAVRYRFGVLERRDRARWYKRVLRCIPIVSKCFPYMEMAPPKVFDKGRVLCIFMYHRISLIDCKEIQVNINGLTAAFDDRSGGRYDAACYFMVMAIDARAIELREMRTNDPLAAIQSVAENAVARVCGHLQTVDMKVLHETANDMFIRFAREGASRYGMVPVRVEFNTAVYEQSLELARAVRMSSVPPNNAVFAIPRVP